MTRGMHDTMKKPFVPGDGRTAHKHTVGRSPGPEQWLLCEWPSDRNAPSKFYLSSLPASSCR